VKLPIQSIPISTWGISLSNKLPREEWDEIRRKVYRDADYRCEVCGSTNKDLHCHEVWKFNDQKLTQSLVGLVCVCELCHDTIHFGRSKSVKSASYVDRLVGHWCRVNGKSRNDFMRYEQEIFEINKRRVDRFYIVKVGRKILV
jgi:hypothetical protein